MSRKPRYFAIVAHCLLNPSTRVHLLGKRYEIAKMVSEFFLSKHVSIIQLPCPEFTAMGYMRNPQGRQQYNNIFFKKHCKKELESFVDMISELTNNNNTPLCFVGIQGSPTCSIYWGKHKLNKYKTESMNEDEDLHSEDTVYGVMTEVLNEMLKEKGICIPYLEAPVKENIESEKSKKFFLDLYNTIKR
ncbi:hypothetical protein [Clostridium chrysemydis]|uniref:hypothetical protein n=1 Tax=Clostridium chrysemydis TaxID=2665504 RepID=UPI001883B12A|nr:hypothetical protein [Clostridium chrysemydis]